MPKMGDCLPFFDVGPDINLVGKGGTWLSMQVPVRIGNLSQEASVSEAPDRPYAEDNADLPRRRRSWRLDGQTCSVWFVQCR